MNVGRYTFAEFVELARSFHGYPAPGLLVGGYMVEEAKAAMPQGTLFEVVVECSNCLPDAVQLLTPCSTGNNWMKVVDLGKFALCMYDKYTGVGVRVHLDPGKLAAWPELRAWFMKTKTKAEQDDAQLRREIEKAGTGVCTTRPIRIAGKFLEKMKRGPVTPCPDCGEGYPQKDGERCRGCQGSAPSSLLEKTPQ